MGEAIFPVEKSCRIAKHLNCVIPNQEGGEDCVREERTDVREGRTVI